jgi:hypothetical protein
MECFLDNGDGEGLRVEVVLQLVLQLSQVLLLNALQKNADTKFVFRISKNTILRFFL